MSILFNNWKAAGLAVLVAALALCYFYIKRAYSYWDRKGFKVLPGVNYLFGHFKIIFFENLFIGDVLNNFYRATTEPFIGIYASCRPILLVRDPKLIQSILIKDFSYFTDR